MLAVLLFFYEFFIGPMNNAFSPQLTESYNFFVQQVSSLNMNSSVFLNAEKNNNTASIQLINI